MDNLRTGEKIAGVSGVLLILIMFIFDWFSVEESGGLGGLNAWQSFGIIDLVLLLAAAAGITLAVMSASRTEVNMPVALSALTAGLGGLAVLLVLFRIISPPEFDVLGVEIGTDREIGVFLGLIATAALAYGGWMAMQEEGASFSGEADRVGGTGDDAPPPPPPPPPAAPPSGQGPAA